MVAGSLPAACMLRLKTLRLLRADRVFRRKERHRGKVIGEMKVMKLLNIEKTQDYEK